MQTRAREGCACGGEAKQTPETGMGKTHTQLSEQMYSQEHQHNTYNIVSLLGFGKNVSTKYIVTKCRT